MWLGYLIITDEQCVGYWELMTRLGTVRCVFQLLLCDTVMGLRTVSFFLKNNDPQSPIRPTHRNLEHYEQNK